MNKEQFLNASKSMRYGFLTALQLPLVLLIAPALLMFDLIIWIDKIKND